MNSLVLACAALCAGPMLFAAISRRPNLIKSIDGFVFITVGGLILLHLTELFTRHEDAGILVALLLGIIGPSAIELRFQKLQKHIHFATLLLASVGFLLHIALDGAALASSSAHDHSLPLAIILHRLPVGLTLWWLLRPTFGLKPAIGALFLTVATTIGGYWLMGTSTFPSASGPILWLQAFVAGSILHVVFFRVHLHTHFNRGERSVETPLSDPVDEHKEKHATQLPYEGLGNLLGIFLLSSLFFFDAHSGHSEHHGHGHAHAHSHGHLGVTESFMQLALESAPALLIAYLGGVLIYGFFPSSSMRWLGGGSTFSQSLRGMLIGLPLPVCSCGVLPYYQALVKKGAPPAAAVAFLIATPELGIDAILLSFPLLGIEFTMTRLVASAVIAVVVAYLMSSRIKRRHSLPVVEETEQLSTIGKFTKGVRYSFVELVDTTAPWMLFGLLLAAFATPLLNIYQISLPDFFEVIVFSLIGMVVYVCASGATPLVAALVMGGVSPGAGLAFLITGPATNVSTFGILSSLHGRNVAIRFGLLMMLCAIAVGMITNLILPEFTVEGGGAHSHGSALVQKICLVLVALLFLSSLVRQGARQFIAHILHRH